MKRAFGFGGCQMTDEIEVRKLKLALVRGIVFATEAAGLVNQGKFLLSIGMHSSWLDTAVRDGATVPLDDYVRVYDAAAEAAGWRSAAQILKSAADFQRDREWSE